MLDYYTTADYYTELLYYTRSCIHRDRTIINRSRVRWFVSRMDTNERNGIEIRQKQQLLLLGNRSLVSPSKRIGHDNGKGKSKITRTIYRHPHDNGSKIRSTLIGLPFLSFETISNLINDLVRGYR